MYVNVSEIYHLLIKLKIIIIYLFPNAIHVYMYYTKETW